MFRMQNHRLIRWSMLSTVGIGWKEAKGGQAKTWDQFMKSLIRRLIRVNMFRLLCWSQIDYCNQWLEAVRDMAQNGSQCAVAFTRYHPIEQETRNLLILSTHNLRCYCSE